MLQLFFACLLYNLIFFGNLKTYLFISFKTSHTKQLIADDTYFNDILIKLLTYFESY
jgi:hypothetical protein